MLVTIGTTDITAYINESSYDVNAVQYGDEWIDGNYDRHFRPKGNKVEGKFTLAFVTESDYNSFITLLESNTVDGYTTATVFDGVSNTGVQGLYRFIRKMTKRKIISQNNTLQLIDVEVKQK